MIDEYDERMTFARISLTTATRDSRISSSLPISFIETFPPPSSEDRRKTRSGRHPIIVIQHWPFRAELGAPMRENVR